jgi:hypothetical protein
MKREQILKSLREQRVNNPVSEWGQHRILIRERDFR